jgi:protein-S-isoprenylcysteine O-methyltransferase Ste14
MLASEKHKITKKNLLIASLISGLLNTANAYLIYMLFPPPSFSRFTGGTFTGGGGGGFTGGGFTGGSSTFQLRASGSSETSFLLLSFITGFLIVLAIVGIALFYARWKTKGTEEEETEETKLEDEEDDEET